MVRPAVMLACALCAPLSASQFSTRLEAVRVDVLAMENGRIVRGLSAADFEVLDNGVVQQVDLVSFEQLPINVILALDMSVSVSGERLEHLRSAGKAVIDGLASEDQAGLVTFSHAVLLRQRLTSAFGAVRKALDDVSPAGTTALVDGTFAAMTMGETDAGRDLLIVFSDGRDTASWLRPASVIDAARRADVTVYSVVVRDAQESRFLEDLSELTGGRVVEIGSTTDLRRTFLAILDEFRQRYLLSYSPRGVSKQGWHRLQVRVKGRRANVTARAGYQAGS